MLYKKLFMEHQRLQSMSRQELNWREQQLSWFSEPVGVKQDQQLVDYIQHNHIQQAMIHGDDFFSQYVNKVDQGPVDLVIWIQNKLFNFEQLADKINNEIAVNLSVNGTLYLAVNKFLCTEPQPGIDLPDDYDDAILEFFDKLGYRIHEDNEQETGQSISDWF